MKALTPIFASLLIILVKTSFAQGRIHNKADLENPAVKTPQIITLVVNHTHTIDRDTADITGITITAVYPDPVAVTDRIETSVRLC